MNEGPEDKWIKLAAVLREKGLAQRPSGEDVDAPHGFATRVVARAAADQRAEATGLAAWRRLSLVGAAGALAILGIAMLAVPSEQPARQFMPVPDLEALPLSSLSSNP